MAQIKISKEELQHDEVMERTDKVLRWIKSNSVVIVTVVAVAFGVYAVAMIMHGNRQETLMRGNNLLSQAQIKYSQALSDTTWSSPERIEAMNEVVRITDQVMQEFPETAVARQALYLKGNAYYSAGDNVRQAAQTGAPNSESAIQAFTRYASEASDSPLEQAKGYLALAYSYENMLFLTRQESYLADATNTYRLIIDNEQAPEFLQAEAMLALGRLLSFQGQVDEAADLFRGVIDLRKEVAVEEDAAQPTRPPEQAAVRQLMEMKKQFSMAQTARLELQRLGIDVEDETAETGAAQ